MWKDFCGIKTKQYSKYFEIMIYVATKKENTTFVAFISKNKKRLQEKGLKYPRKFHTEQQAIMWINENFLVNEKRYV
jgi:thiamine pyrophosphokinase